MIFAAGLGTRLFPLTADKPKALVEIQGKPLLAHVIEKLVNAGFSDIVVNVHHFSNLIIDYLKKNDFGANIVVSDESLQLLDTAGGLKFAEHFFDGVEDILLYNVDILSTIDLKKFYSFHLKNNALATLAVRDRKTSRYFVFDENDAQLLGWHNKENGEVKKSRDFVHPMELAFSGIHIVKRNILDLIPAGQKISMTPIYLELAKNHKIVAYNHSDDEWCDVGKLEMVYQLNKLENKS